MNDILAALQECENEDLPMFCASHLFRITPVDINATDWSSIQGKFLP